jgi:hypothetical protein
MFGWLAAYCILTGLTSSGCGNAKPQSTFPVSGVLQWNDGKPATELALATVTLNGKEGEGPTIPVSPRGQVKADGTFVLQTYEPGDGAPVGVYRASVTPNSESRDTPGFGLEDKGPRPSQIMDLRFQSSQTSDLEVTIKPEENQLKLTVERAKR